MGKALGVATLELMNQGSFLGMLCLSCLLDIQVEILNRHLDTRVWSWGGNMSQEYKSGNYQLARGV